MSAERSGASLRSFAAALALVLMFVPYLIKRMVLVGVPGEVEWLAWDYSVRCVSMVGVLIYLRSGLMQEQPARASSLKTVLIFAVALCIEYLHFVLDDELARHVFPAMGWFEAPIIKDQNLLMLDLTIGIALVAVSEELVYRKVGFSVLRHLNLGMTKVVLVSSIVFGLVHFSSGPQNVASAFFSGLVLGTVYRMTGRLSACIVIHYVDDFLVYGWRAVQALDLAR